MLLSGQADLLVRLAQDERPTKVLFNFLKLLKSLLIDILWTRDAPDSPQLKRSLRDGSFLS